MIKGAEQKTGIFDSNSQMSSLKSDFCGKSNGKTEKNKKKILLQFFLKILIPKRS